MEKKFLLQEMPPTPPPTPPRVPPFLYGPAKENKSKVKQNENKNKVQSEENKKVEKLKQK